MVVTHDIAGLKNKNADENSKLFGAVGGSYDRSLHLVRLVRSGGYGIL